MNRFFLLCLFIALSLLSATGQQELVVSIPWTSSETSVYEGNVYDFPHLSDGYVNPVNGLPFYIHSLQLDKDFNIEEVDFVGGEESYLLRSSSLGGRLVSEVSKFKVEWFVSTENGNRTLYITCNPLFLDDSGNLKFYRSLSFKLRYSNVTVAKLKGGVVPFATSSVLSSGKWVKISVDKSGVFKLDYETLKSWGFANPNKVHIFGNGGEMLTKVNSETKADDLLEIPLYDTGNSLLFYCSGVISWAFNPKYEMYLHKLNIYDKSSYYFITESDLPRKVIPDLPFLAEFDTVSTTYTGYDCHELDMVNLLKSGKVWLGEEFSKSRNLLNYTFSFSTPHISQLKSENLKFYSEVVARSDKNSSFKFYVNKGQEASISVACASVSLGSITERYADERVVQFNTSSAQDNTELAVQFEPISNSSVGWLNLISMNSRNELAFIDGWLSFRDPEITEEGITTKFSMTGTSGKNIVLWDITSPSNPKNISITKSNDQLSFIVEKSQFQEFLAFDVNSSFQTPAFVENVNNQNLHGLDQTEYIIVAPAHLLDEANRLAEIHRTYNDINPTVVSTESVYNEFSSGKQDPVAIRSFVRMFYSRADESKANAPKYLLLYGDGSYDNLGVNPANKSKVVTYQSDKSFHQTESYVTDDFFGFLDDNEGGSESVDKLDIGIGRFVVNSIEEAKIANEKVLSYLTGQDKEDWQSRITFLAQDGDDNLHQRDAEDLSTYVRTYNPEFNLNKIYADAYPKQINSQTGSFPEAEKVINSTLNVDGTLIFNYTGHGAVEAIAYKFLTLSKADNLSNIKRLPLFVTATCEISRFDNPEEKSLGEHLFLNPNGGGIGLLSTTRVVYSFFNKNLNLNFYKNVFLKDENNLPLRIGEVMRKTKNGSISGVNKLNFTLLCDPALRLNYPIESSKVSQINDVRTNQPIDTIHGLTHGMLAGEVLNENLTLTKDFNGTATIAIYDKPSKVTTLGNGGQKPFVYEDYQSVLYKGKVDVKNGLFSSEFVIPSDIRYDYEKGRITLFCSSDSSTAFGYNNGYYIGGIDENVEYDDLSPDLSLFLNSTAFKDGGKCGANPIFISEIFDSQGINTAGAGIGHDLLLTIDDDPYKSFAINNHFAFDKDSYQSGEVRYQLTALAPGMHTLSFRVWDCNNNSTTKSISFEVVNDNELIVNNISVFPNPVSQSGIMSLLFTHDEPNTNLDIVMEVYGMDGRLVHRSNYERADKNGIITPIEWQPTTIGGGRLDLGIYLCKLWVTSSTGQKSNFSKRFVVIQ